MSTAEQESMAAIAEGTSAIKARREKTYGQPKPENAQQRAEGMVKRHTALKGAGPNTKRQLEVLLRDKYGSDFDVIMRMAEHAHNISMRARVRPDDVTAQMDAIQAWAKLAPYVKPQLKAVDLTSGGEQVHFGFQLNLAGEDKQNQPAPIDITPAPASKAGDAG